MTQYPTLVNTQRQEVERSKMQNNREEMSQYHEKLIWERGMATMNDLPYRVSFVATKG
jgi:hypothetical protein